MQTTARRKAPTRAVPSGRKSCLTVLLIATAVALAARAGAAGGEAPSVSTRGGGDPNQQPTREEQTLIGHFEGGPAHP